MPEVEREHHRNNSIDAGFSSKSPRAVVIPPSRPASARTIANPPAEPRPIESRPLTPLPQDEALVREFVKAALATSDTEIRAFVDAQLAEARSVQSIYLDLLAPAARVLGEMWVEDSCDFVEVTMAVGRLQLVLRDLSQLFVRDRPQEQVAGRVLLACVPGDQHSLGLFMVAEFFVRDGWEVHVGPPLTDEQLLADVRSEWYDVVGFSVSCDSRLDHLKREIHRVRHASLNRDVVVLAGGRVFNEHPSLVERIGADASAANAELAPECARRLLTR